MMRTKIQKEARFQAVVHDFIDEMNKQSLEEANYFASPIGESSGHDKAGHMRPAGVATDTQKCQALWFKKHTETLFKVVLLDGERNIHKDQNVSKQKR